VRDISKISRGSECKNVNSLLVAQATPRILLRRSMNIAFGPLLLVNTKLLGKMSALRGPVTRTAVSMLFQCSDSNC
jgi:hypothetical protein